MSNQFIAVIVCTLIFCIALSSCNNVKPETWSICQPGIVEGMAPEIRKICTALEKSDELSAALRDYINKEYGPQHEYNREDIEHSILHFGKRR